MDIKSSGCCSQIAMIYFNKMKLMKEIFVISLQYQFRYFHTKNWEFEILRFYLNFSYCIINLIKHISQFCDNTPLSRIAIRPYVNQETIIDTSLTCTKPSKKTRGCMTRLAKLDYSRNVMLEMKAQVTIMILMS